MIAMLAGNAAGNHNIITGILKRGSENKLALLKTKHLELNQVFLSRAIFRGVDGAAAEKHIEYSRVLP